MRRSREKPVQRLIQENTFGNSKKTAKHTEGR